MSDRTRWRRLARFLYAPLVVFSFLVVVNAFVSRIQFNPWSAGQNPRLTIASPGSDGGPEDSPALAVIRPLFPPDSPLRVLTTQFPRNTGEALSILFVGNSQTIATMDEQPGDRYAPVWLWQLLNDGRGGTERFVLRIGSEPNLTMSELLVKAVLGVADVRRRVDVLVAAIMPDQFRWANPRETIAARVRSAGIAPLMRDVLAGMEDLPDGGRIVNGLLGGGGSDSIPLPGVRQPAAPTRFDRGLEDRVQAALDASVPLFRKRQALYGRVALGFQDARNRVLGVHTSTLRPIPEEMHRLNLQVVEGMIRYLRRAGVHVAIYLAPIRPIRPNPTGPADLERFRKDMLGLCARAGAVCLDYSELIPEEMWTNYPEDDIGGKSGERDYSHFTGRGHRRLGEQLMHDLGPQLERWLEEKKSAPGPS